MIIPNDTGKNWRRNKLVEYIGSFPDEIGPIIRHYFKVQHMDKDSQVWWVLLYSACYCMGTACVLEKELDYKTVRKKELSEFWEINKPNLLFQSDRRYIKNMNQFNDIAWEFLTHTERKPWDYINRFITDDPYETYQKLYKEVSSWKYYGRFGTILFLYNLHKLVGVDLDYDEYDWKSGKTTTSALFNAFYLDERAEEFEKDGKLIGDELSWLDDKLYKLIKVLKKKYPDKDWTIMGVTSDLCSYRKLFKQTRYLGYYVDRQQEEIKWLQIRWPRYKDLWKSIWKWRQKVIDPQYLGELNGYFGVQKDLMTTWTKRGEFR
jgi:hypothetical protein